MNLVMTDKGEITEIQGTGEGQPFTMEELNQMLLLGRYGIKELIAKQEEALGELNILVGIQP